MIQEAYHEDENVRSKLTQSLGGITKIEFSVIGDSFVSPFMSAQDLRFDTSIDEYEERLPETLRSMAAHLTTLAAQIESRIPRTMTVDEMAKEVDDGTVQD